MTGNTGMNLLILAAVFIAGGLIALQGATNASLSRFLNHPLQAALVSFGVGTLSLALMNLMLRTTAPSLSSLKQAPWYLWCGGLFGAVIVSSAIFFIPKIGATKFVSAVIVGQLAASVAIDHFGILGIPVHRLSMTRVAGIGLLIVGFALIKRG